MMITDILGSSLISYGYIVYRKIERKNEYILTLQDQLIKFCMDIPLPDQTIEIAKAEEDLLIGSSIYWEHQKQY